MSGEIHQVEAVDEREQRASVPGEGHRADVARHLPGAKLPPVGGAAVDPVAEAVDEPQPLGGDVPQRPLAEQRLDVDEHVDGDVRGRGHHQKRTDDSPFSPSVARASSGVASAQPIASRIVRTRLTC